MTATDGIVASQPLNVVRAKDTGTRAIAKEHGKEALGDWEHKVLQGIHLIRPGIAFPLGTADEKETKGRGVGKSTIAKAREQILASWAEHGPKANVLQTTLFRGMKSCTSYVQEQFKRHAEYGTWRQRDTQVSYWPEPKRPALMRDDGGLYTWSFGRDVSSAPYERIQTAETRALKLRELIASEQPDGLELPNEL